MGLKIIVTTILVANGTATPKVDWIPMSDQRVCEVQAERMTKQVNPTPDMLLIQKADCVLDRGQPIPIEPVYPQTYPPRPYYK